MFKLTKNTVSKSDLLNRVKKKFEEIISICDYNNLLIQTYPMWVASSKNDHRMKGLSF